DHAAAARLLTQAEPALSRAASASEDRQTLLGRIDRLAPALDAVDRAVARTGGGRKALADAILARNEARAYAMEGQLALATSSLERAIEHAASAYGRAIGGEEGAQAAQVVKRHAEATRMFASASEKLAQDDWTRPMLSMREQL